MPARTDEDRHDRSHPTLTPDVPQADLDDLRDRLARTRRPGPSPVEDGRQGPSPDGILALVDPWRGDHDWRRCEAYLNGFGRRRIEIDGLGIHCLHSRSRHEEETPLILTHGWPASGLGSRHLIDPFVNPTAHGGGAADAFRLVIPFLPGFGFPDAPIEPCLNLGRLAVACARSMKRLGCEHQGGDRGAAVIMALGHMAPPGPRGIHLNFLPFQPTDTKFAEAGPVDAARSKNEHSADPKQMGTRPQSVASAHVDPSVSLGA